ncbi:kallikrein-15-like [Sebastes umbrosus]|uniref:kallikrein-15-like n=1 Tax=Sebastes umbrosus TaxID=72105 RepID=UPI00189E304C|nr:kallikrein-15-like [Sebastes umbrosus]
MHDIMLLELTNPTQIQPVRLPNCSNPLKIGDTVEIAGRAAKTLRPNKEREPGIVDVLQCAKTTIVDRQDLKDRLQKNYEGFDEFYGYQHWQSYQRPGVDASVGDSGGGVVFNGMIYGVNAFVGNDTHGTVAPAGFMDVCKYMKWISNTIGIA